MQALRGLLSRWLVAVRQPLALVLPIVVFFVYLRYQLYICDRFHFPCRGDDAAVWPRSGLLTPLELAACALRAVLPLLLHAGPLAHLGVVHVVLNRRELLLRVLCVLHRRRDAHLQACVAASWQALIRLKGCPGGLACEDGRSLRAQGQRRQLHLLVALLRLREHHEVQPLAVGQLFLPLLPFLLLLLHPSVALPEVVKAAALAREL